MKNEIFPRNNRKYCCPTCGCEQVQPFEGHTESGCYCNKKCPVCGWTGPDSELKEKFEFIEARISDTWSKNKRNDGGFSIDWAVKSWGFGGITFIIKNGKLYMDTEYMGKDFVKQCLNAVIDDAILQGSPEDKREVEKPASKEELKKAVKQIKSCAKKGRLSFREIKLRDKYKNSANEKRVEN